MGYKLGLTHEALGFFVQYRFDNIIQRFVLLGQEKFQ
jgi:hypothetical protein